MSGPEVDGHGREADVGDGRERTDDAGPWFRIGYALERTRSRMPGPGGGRRASRGGRSGADAEDEGSGGTGPADAALEAFLLSGGSVVVGRLLRAWPGRGSPGPVRLLRAAVAGAGARLGTLLVGTAVRGDPRLPGSAEALGERLLAGAARGLVYASVVEPRVPGPPLLRGLVYGGLEAGLAPWGGLEALLGAESPRRRMPFLGSLLGSGEESGHGKGGDAGTGDAVSLEDHLFFGAVLAELYD